MESGSKAGIIALLVGLLVIGGGAVYLLTRDNGTEETETTTQMVEQEEAVESSDIVELALATPSLSTLVSAVQTAGLVETLQSEGPFTVLAPSNSAFESALAELNLTAEELLASEDLANILTYHVIAGSVLSSQLQDGQVISTVNGTSTLTVSITDDGVFFVDENGRSAQVTSADIMASNGVIHLIDNVLLP